MSVLPNEFHGDAISTVVREMEHTDGVCDAISAGAQATGGFLAANWFGSASTRFQLSLSQWNEGLAQVKQGLIELNTALGQHMQASVNLEEDNSRFANFNDLAGYDDSPTWT